MLSLFPTNFVKHGKDLPDRKALGQVYCIIFCRSVSRQALQGEYRYLPCLAVVVVAVCYQQVVHDIA